MEPESNNSRLVVRINDVPDSRVAELFKQFSSKWVDQNGLTAVGVMETFYAEGGMNSAYISQLQNQPTTEDIAFIRRCMIAYVDSGDPFIAKCIEDALEREEVAVAQSGLATMALAGLIAIGLVLAARVKRIGDAEFYQGVPPEVVKILERTKPSAMD